MRNQSTSTHLAYIDSLGGLAFLGVLLVHCGHQVADLPPSLKALTLCGQYGVQLFFVASAFTLFLSYHQRAAVDHRPAMAFFIRRFFRIAPLYWGAVAFYLLLGYLRPGILQLGNARLDEIAANVCFFHAWYPRSVNGIVPGGWSVGVEMSFYLMIPLLFRYVNSWRRGMVLFALCLGLHALSGPVANWLIAGTVPGQMMPGAKWYPYFWLPSQLPVFALGIILFFVWRAFPVGSAKWRLQRVVCLVASIGLMTTLVTLHMTPKPAGANWGHIMFGFAFVLLTLAVANNPPWCVNRFTRFLGMVSYSAYLTHFVALAVVAALLRRVGAFATFSPLFRLLLLLTVALGVTLTLSYIVYRFVEKPGIAMGKKVISQLGAGQRPYERETAASPMPVMERYASARESGA